MRFIGTFLIAVLLMAAVARAALPDLSQASCSGNLVASDVCQMPGLPAKTSKPVASACCAALPDLSGPALHIDRLAGRSALPLARDRQLPDRSGRSGPWRPPRG